MEAIKLNTRLGNCTLKISAQLRNDKMQQLAEYALQYLIWHVVPAEAYNKTSDFKRDALYSDGLSKHLIASCNEVLGKCFSDIAINTAKYDKPDPIAKLIKEFVSLGMSEDDAKAMAKEVEAKAKAKPESKTEVKTETTVEA